MFSKSNHKFLIGMIHLPPLAGYPNHHGLEATIAHAIRELKTLEEAGFDAVLIENDTDQPHRITVTKAVRDSAQKVLEAVLAEAKIPVGIEVLYDMKATLEIAIAAGADFVRFDVFNDDTVTKWGLVKAEAGELVALRNAHGDTMPLIFADVHVKHATLAQPKDLADSVEQSAEKGADGLIITGNWTGKKPKVDDLKLAKSTTDKPVIIGSGLNNENIHELLPLVDGAIVGTSIKTDGFVDPQKAKQLVLSSQHLSKKVK